MEDDVLTFSSSILKIKIGLGSIENWIIPDKGFNCTKMQNGLTCRASIKREANLEIFFVINNNQIERISFSAEMGADIELKKAVQSFLKTATLLPDTLFDGVSFKAAKLGKQKLTYQFHPTMSFAMLDLEQ
jgi:hypothetical protein